MYGINYELNKNNVLLIVSDYEIMKFYIPWYIPNVTIKSPFANDKKPSFWSIVRSDGSIYFRDPPRGYRGDCFNLVQIMFMLTFIEALEKINIDFKLNLGLNYEINHDYQKTLIERPKTLPDKKKLIFLQYDTREWNHRDSQYWLRSGVSLSLIRKYKIVAAKQLFVNTLPFETDLHYSYVWHTHEHYIKFYQPFKPYDKKWRANTIGEFWQGELFLPNKGKQLIIQSSQKDGMVVENLFNIPFVADNTENVNPLKEKLELFESRFDEIFVLYDNDEAGITNSEELCTERKYKNIILPKYNDLITDPSSFCWYGRQKQLYEFLKPNFI